MIPLKKQQCTIKIIEICIFIKHLYLNRLCVHFYLIVNVRYIIKMWFIWFNDKL